MERLLESAHHPHRGEGDSDMTHSRENLVVGREKLRAQSHLQNKQVEEEDLARERQKNNFRKYDSRRYGLARFDL